MLSASGICHQCIGVYHDLCVCVCVWGGGGGGIVSALEGYHDLCGGYHRCIGVYHE